MPSPTRLTVTSTFRIHRAQQEALIRVAHIYTLSPSAIVRALLQLYLEDKIPEALTIAIAETKRAEAVMLSGKAPVESKS